MSSVLNGYCTIASNAYSTTSGRYTIASGIYSTASGYCTTASGNLSTASGCCTTASGSYNFVYGLCSCDNGCAYTYVFGLNVVANRGNTLFAENLSLTNIPTSSAGLPSGAVWSNSGILTIVP
jgi:hypothetical protein